MKRKLVGISIFCLVLGSLFYMSYTKKNSMPDYMSYLPAEDTVLHNMKKLALHGETVKEMSFLYIWHIQVHVLS